MIKVLVFLKLASASYEKSFTEGLATCQLGESKVVR
jgi:hypothetical protein